jgi:hypothetical protein
MENKLKPCPFCLSEAEMHIREDSLDCFAYKKSEIPKTARLVCEKKYPGRDRYYVYRRKLYIPRCTISSCFGRNTKGFESKQEAIVLWNTRTEVKDDEN